MKRLRLFLISIFLTLILFIHFSSALSSNQYNFLDEIFDDSVKYFLSPEAITSYGLPLTAYKSSDRARFGYSNPTEWGYTLQAFITARERGIITENEAINKIDNTLNTIRLLQNNQEQNYQGIFYPYYKVTDSQGNDIFPYHDSNPEIPSIDNAILYASLLIIEGWAKENNYPLIELKARTIKNSMDFRMFLFASNENKYIAHTINAQTGTLSSAKWDIYADDGGLMSLIAYISDSINFEEFKELTNSQLRNSATWNSYDVEEAAWFNAMFTWGVRQISGINILGTPYSVDSFLPAVKAHLAYGDWLGIDYPAFSDAMSQTSGGIGLVRRYTPPNLANEVPSIPPEHVVPHALFVPFNILSDLDDLTVERLIEKIRLLKEDSQGYYHNYPGFGFEVTSSPYIDTSYSGTDDGRGIFETLSQSYIVLSLFNALQEEDEKDNFYTFAGNVIGYQEKISDTFSFLYYEPLCEDLYVSDLINSASKITAIAIGDINDDYIKEVVYSTYNADNESRLYVYDFLNKAIIWEYSLSLYDYISYINITDIDQDGENEIILSGKEITILDAKNQIEEWSTESINRGYGYFNTKIENIDDDTNDEIIAVEAWWDRGGNGGIVYIIDGITKEIRSSYIFNWTAAHYASINYIGDIDKDGIQEIGVSAQAYNYIYIIDSTNLSNTEWKSPSFGWLNRGSRILDIDNDNIEEIIAVSGDGEVYIWNLTGEEWNKTDYYWIDLVDINDLDNDNYTEIIIREKGYGHILRGFSILDPKTKTEEIYLYPSVMEEIKDIGNIDDDISQEIIGISLGYFSIKDGTNWNNEWTSEEPASEFIKSIEDIDNNNFKEIIYQDYDKHIHIINGNDKREIIKSSLEFPNITNGNIFVESLDNDDFKEFIIKDDYFIIIFNVTINSPPILDIIGDKTINESELLEFTVSASDIDDDILTYTAYNLPSGASFSNRVFSWIPNYEQAGAYYVTFNVNDCVTNDSETIKITVNNVEFITINSPVNEEIYNSQYVLVNITLEEQVKTLYGKINNGSWIKACENCNNFSKTVRFPEGRNNLIVKAIAYDVSEHFASIAFVIDTTKPVIHNTYPEALGNGTFAVQYTEANLENITLQYGTGWQDVNEKVFENCISGNRKWCIDSVDLSRYNNRFIYYRFIVKDKFYSTYSYTRRIYVQLGSGEKTEFLFS